AVLREVAGVAARHTVEQLVLQADVGERATDHDLVVAATRAERVVVLALHAVGVQVLGRGRARLDRRGGGDVVGGDRVPELGQDARAGDVLDRGRLLLHVVEERGLAHVGRLVVPLEGRAVRGLESGPARVAR